MVLKIIITVVVMIICVALVVLIAKQESKTSGLGALSGSMVIHRIHTGERTKDVQEKADLLKEQQSAQSFSLQHVYC